MRKFGEIVDIPALTPAAPARRTFKGRFKIKKSADDKMLAFGWASVAVRSTGEQIEDWQEDMIDPDDLEAAAYEFAELYREGGEMHERGGTAKSATSFTEEYRLRNLDKIVDDSISNSQPKRLPFLRSSL